MENLVLGKQKVQDNIMIKVVFFAALREKLGCNEISIDHNDITNVAQLKQALTKLNPEWHQPLQENTVLMAVNNDMVNAEHIVNSGDEVAFFPPVTGG